MTTSRTVMQAIRENDVEALGKLLDDGADYYFARDPPCKRLHAACVAAQASVPLLDAFLSRGLVAKNSVDAGDLLQWAAADRNGAKLTDYVLRKLGTHPDTLDSDGNTILGDLVYLSTLEYSRGYIKVIEVLLRHGSDPNRRSNMKETPRQMAMKSKSPELQEVMGISQN